jgi:hypothetical protein
MSNDPNPHDEAIDKVFAVLRAAAPPEGMETRIAQRLHQHATTSNTASRLPVHLPAGSTLAGAWWRGAISGAAAAMVAAVVFFYAAHLLPTNPARQTAKLIANRGTSAPVVALARTPINSIAKEPNTHPCSRQTVLRVPPAPAPTEQRLRAETHIDTAAPSHPAPALPLTSEERSLVQLAHTADPSQLTSLNPDAQAKLQAEDAAEFAKFFNPPHQPPAVKNNE